MQIKLYLQTAVFVFLLIIIFWWGEAGGGIESTVQVLLISIFLSSAAFFIKKKLIYKLATYGVLVSLLMCAYQAGQASMGRAFNHCVEHGEDVRVDLQKYFEVHHRYPNVLAELDNKTCDRILRPSILSYLPVNQGYQLYFGDSFVSFTANESQPFEAHK